MQEDKSLRKNYLGLYKDGHRMLFQEKGQITLPHDKIDLKEIQERAAAA